MSDPATSASIRARSARLRRCLTALLATLAALLLLERFGAIGLQLLRAGLGRDEIRRLGFQGVMALPEVLDLLALCWIRQALAGFAKGELYSPTVTRMLDRVGSTLAAATFLTVFLLPSLTALLGFGPGYLVAYDLSSLVLGAIGLSLKVIAHVLRGAAEAQAEFDQIF